MRKRQLRPANDNGSSVTVTFDIADHHPATESELGILENHFSVILERMVEDAANDDGRRKAKGSRE